MLKTSLRVVTFVMVGGPFTIFCSTVGSVTLLTPTTLRDPLTGQNAILPEGACVTAIRIYRDNDLAVTSGSAISLGVVGSTSKYMGTLEGFNTSQLNNGHCISKIVSSDIGLSAAAELRVTLATGLSAGSIVFEVDYFVYA